MVESGNTPAFVSKGGGKATEDSGEACYPHGDPSSYEGARNVFGKAVPVRVDVVLE